jgi:glycine dehydrogenase
MTYEALLPSDTFPQRHLGPGPAQIAAMLRTLDVPSLEALADRAVPTQIRMEGGLDLPAPLSEQALIEQLRGIMSENAVYRSFIGMGYADCIVPPVIQRNILENPGWYTQYTPYQAEISQGRLEALINFQTMVADLTGLPLSNASLLDEGTAAAEAMAMAIAVGRNKRHTFFVADHCHPQTIEVVRTRAEAAGIRVVVGSVEDVDAGDGDLAGVLVQSPDTHGVVRDVSALADALHANKSLLVVATDLLACAILRPPGEEGADIVVGNSQRFGVPLGFGGPHAGFMSCRDTYRRQMPGRIVGVSRDTRGKPAYRLALQTREQHIRRDKATSNICTAQVLLAIMAGMYGVYHGPEGLRRIAGRVHGMTRVLAAGLRAAGFGIAETPYFDTLQVNLPDGGADAVHTRADQAGINLRPLGDDAVGITLDERTTLDEIATLIGLFTGAEATVPEGVALDAPADHARTSEFMTHPVFSAHHSEHGLLRYIHALQGRDLSLTTSMIPLGSCTMKLNGTSELVPVSWPEVNGLHPFAPAEQTAGYRTLFEQLEAWLADITGFDAVSLQPNAGSQGEYAGLLVIRAWQRDRGETQRDVCLIPTSAHGTNPASAVMAGMRVVPVKCDDQGNIDLADLREKAAAHAEKLSALMITYPSTHGVFEEDIKDICGAVHEHGGQVYMDGANMNAQVGLCRPGDLGADVVHLNLHKTFCIPHGGGGPGMGPIAVAKHLAPFLPGHPVTGLGGEKAIGPIAAAPYGSPSILPISWVYIAAMGAEGLTRATQVAILNANYMAKRLSGAYDILYTGRDGFVAHEFILDCRPFKASAGIEVEDIAKRLMDYGFHAPTMSWPVPGTLMVEPTESEDQGELDRFCEAMLAIREEIRAIEEGRLDAADNPLKNAPHTAEVCTATEWAYGYPREQAAYPLGWVRARKFWPAVGRVDNAYGDRNLMCSCPPMEAYAPGAEGGAE